MDVDRPVGAISPQALSVPTAKGRLQRARTGCLKCRRRRRKCDESKPRCQRCVDAGFECRYPSGVTFLDKNALTVSPSSNPASSSRPTYRRLQFIDQGLPRSRPRPPRHNSSPVSQSALPQGPSSGPPPPASQWPSVLLPSGAGPTGGNDERLAWASTVAPEPAASPLIPGLPSSGAELGMPAPGAVSPSGGYETALHALVSLGSDKNASPRLSRGAERISQPQAGVAIPATSSPGAHIQVFEPRSSSSSTSASPQPALVSGHPVTQNAGRESHLRLLRHYRYEVSPWLDICDAEQTFGLCVSRMATQSQPVLQALLQLSAAALNAGAGADGAHDTPPPPFTSEQAVSTTSPSPSSYDEIIATTLMFVHRSITSESVPWQSPLLDFDAASACVRLHVVSPRLCRCLSFLLLRLDFAAALQADVTASARQPLVDTLLQWNPCSWEEDMFYQASRPFLLCARLLSFCSAESTPSSPASSIPWHAVAEEANTWYANRPQEFQAMVELEHDDNGKRRLFPAILFSSGAAVFANQLYHTAMLILLQRKPRTALLGIRSSSLLSPLWHVQRICGIALNNDRRECWDPSLVASLHLAARGITYEPQQREILGALESIEALTSWDMGYFATDLHARWGLVPG